MAEFKMPSLGADMEAGTLVAWKRAIGDVIARGDVVAEVETDKGIVEVESFVPGVLERFLVEPGQRVPVGAPLAIVRGEGETAAAPPPASVSVASAPEKARASPFARRRALELGVDLATVPATGPHGTITAEDVERAAKAPEVRAPVEAAKASGPSRMQRAVAATMARSKREVPHFYLATTIDMAPVLAFLDAANEKRPVEDRVLPAALVLRAAARAARAAPELNARWDGDTASPSAAVHLGIAISLRGGGLVAPAIHDADRLDLDALMRAFRDLVARARAGTLRSSEMSDPTLTVTSLGDRGVPLVFPIIFPPQVAIVGVGVTTTRPWVVDGVVVARPLVDVSLAADHRVSDGHRASRYLAALADDLAHPERT